MRIRGIMLVAACVYAVGVVVADDGDVIKNETKKLQGIWRPLALEEGGKQQPEEAAKLPKLGIKENKFTTPGVDPEFAVYNGKFQLDVTEKVKRLTLHSDVDGPNGPLTFHAIYKINGSELTLCINPDGTNKERPSDFVTKKDSPFLTITFQREKE